MNTIKSYTHYTKSAALPNLRPKPMRSVEWRDEKNPKFIAHFRTTLSRRLLVFPPSRSVEFFFPHHPSISIGNSLPFIPISLLHVHPSLSSPFFNFPFLYGMQFPFLFITSTIFLQISRSLIAFLFSSTKVLLKFCLNMCNILCDPSVIFVAESAQMAPRNGMEFLNVTSTYINIEQEHCTYMYLRIHSRLVSSIIKLYFPLCSYPLYFLLHTSYMI